MDREEQRKAFREEVDKTYKVKGMIQPASAYQKFKRFSTGIFSFDLALGGGLPFGQMSLIHGTEHSGKTLVATQAMKAIRGYCSLCKQIISACACKEPVPCTSLFIDVEDKYNRDWALVQGLGLDEYEFSRVEYAEQAVDILEGAIDSGGYDLIVLDSLAALCPIKEIESSAEDQQVGLMARLLNKGFRKWVRALMKSETHPHVMFVNQNRFNVGVLYGDPVTLPGGQAQKFNCSIRVAMKAPKIETPKEMSFPSIAELGGRVAKNGTFVPKIQFTYRMGLRDSSELKRGEINNVEQIFNYAKLFGLLEQAGEGQKKGYVLRMAETVVASGKTIKATFANLRNVVEGEVGMLGTLWKGLLEVGCKGVCSGDFCTPKKAWHEE